MTAQPLTETTRELACLALGHEDSGAPRCPESDERLVADLVTEVQHLRVLAGVVEETSVDRQEARTALDDALTEAHIAEVPDGDLAEELLGHLSSNGWRLIRRRP